MKKTLQFLSPIGLKAAAGEKQRRFSILAYNGGTLSVDGFPLPVIVDLSGLEVPSAIPILIDHKKSVEATLGVTDKIENTGTNLVLSGIVTGQSPVAQQVLAQADAGHQWQASIGAMVGDSEDIAAGQSVQVNGQTFVGPVIVARRSVLRETSVLPMGADATTQVNLAARAAGLLKGAAAMSFEEWLMSLKIDNASLNDQDRAALQLAYDAAQNTTATPAPAATAAQAAAPVAAPAPAAAGAVLNLHASIADQNKMLADNLRRNAEIQAAAAGFPLIAAKAIEAGWSVDKTKLAVMEAQQERTRPTSFHAAEKNLPQNDVIEAAVCMARKLPDTEKAYKPEVLQAAHTAYRGRLGLQQLIITAAVANGYNATPGERCHNGNLRDILECACPPRRMLSASGGFSTVNLPGILSNVANKEILQGYMSEDPAWQEIAAKRSVSDFKTVTSYRMLDDMTYEELGPGGAIKGGSIGEESYTRQAKTYAKMFVLERTQIINDDLGAFDDLRNRVGRGYVQKLTSVFWTAFVNNSTFFTTARTNYITGSTSNLGTDGVGLGLGVTAFRKMTSPSADGTKRVGAGQRPEILLVPPELEFTADNLYRNGNLGAVKAADANVFVNKYRPVVAWQLSDSTFTGYSTTAWYLLANPATMPTIVVSFLNGQETPTVEQADADFNQLGIQFRGYHDFGVDMAEYLGGLKSKGAA